MRSLDELLFEPSNARLPVRVRLSPDLPSDGTREIDCEEPTSDVRIVLHSRLARYVHEALAGHQKPLDRRTAGRMLATGFAIDIRPRFPSLAARSICREGRSIV